jgi:hypothetical protein
MKFIHYLEKITGVGIYPLSSFVIFAGFFLIMLIWVLRADKKALRRISHIPLD